MDVRVIEQFDRGDLQGIISGYRCAERYDVRKIEVGDSIVFTVELVQLDTAYVKRYKLPDDATLQHYQESLAFGLSFGAYEDTQLIGLALAEPHDWNKSAWVSELHVTEAYRGKGIGSQLMDALAQRCREMGLHTIVCETQNTNVPAIRFYRKVGFRLDGIDLSYYGDESEGEAALFMKRKL